jgi:precorrin-6A/cobalt-precorrin-6A reductase
VILILGGTTEARAVAAALQAAGEAFVSSRATDYRPPGDTGPQVQRRFDDETLASFLAERGIDVMIDATPPFAEEISRTAMRVSSSTGVPLVRFERPREPVPVSDLIVRVDSTAEAVDELADIPGRILLATGVRTLPVFVSGLAGRMEDLVVRVLPHSSSLAECERLGVPPARIVAMQGPFDERFNAYLIERFDVRAMVSKESGREGGLREKIRACLGKGVRLVLIAPPRIEHPHAASSVREVLGAVSVLRGGPPGKSEPEGELTGKGRDPS